MNGVYSAINKGIRECKGDYVSILHSGDCYTDSMFNSIGFLNDLNYEAVFFGNISLICRQSKKIIDFKLESNDYRLLPCDMSIFHPAIVVSNSIYKKYGFYSEDFPIAADFKYLRELYLSGVKFEYINSTLVLMEYGGISTQFTSALSIANEKNKILNSNKTTLFQYYYIIRSAVLTALSLLKNKIYFCWK